MPVYHESSKVDVRGVPVLGQGRENHRQGL